MGGTQQGDGMLSAMAEMRQRFNEMAILLNARGGAGMPPIYQQGQGVPQACGGMYPGADAQMGGGKGASEAGGRGQTQDAREVLMAALQMNGPGMAAEAQQQGEGFPFEGPPRGEQGAYPGSWVGGQWNQHHAPGSGMYGWKLDVDKEIPYFPLEFSGARNLMNIPCTPLRVAERWANSLLWTIFTAYQNSSMWIDRKVGGWKKGRNQREAETPARVLDLAITEFGTRVIERSAAFEVLLRRLHAIVIADNQGHWEIACLLEEIPTPKTPGLHEVIVKKMVNLSKLIDDTSKAGKSSTPGLEDDG
jgi:hypothetical protein